ncbi:tripartite tricarboxylate transporter TctB family protein [Aeromicrobium sp.]|uniref:tripartite tricarboxylate transporter TctB family protein n=1 Tax=Aeromicrobium sp. TaxID=1871063 RepID=UPI0028AD0091|nr:tripartite tricarboxylate transporter TctB family protein [Aeromicrobium sp.]
MAAPAPIDSAASRSRFAAGAAIAGIAYAVTAVSYDLGTVASPGAGALPFAVGCATAVIGAFVAVADRRGTRAEALATETASADERGDRSSRFGPRLTLVIAALACVFMIWQARIVGLLPAVGLGIAVLAWTMRSRVLTALLTGTSFYLFSFVVFHLWLEVPLPRGYF